MMSIKTNTTCTRAIATAAGILFLALVVQAQPTAHYVPGVEGIKGASLPPPGFYLRDYNAFYYADQMNDRGGDKVKGIGADVFIYANVPRLVWITDLELLGGNIGVDALLPLQYTDLNVDAANFDDSTFGIGDLFAETTWSKHMKQFDFSLGAGVWAPTGDSSDKLLTTRAGLGYWTAMLTAGATWYVDAEKLWSISALNRYEFNTEKDHAASGGEPFGDYTPGQAYTLEWGVSRALSKTVDVGLAGYYQMQVTDDTVSRAPGAGRDSVAAIGPEVTVFYPRFKLGWSLRYDYEFLAESRFQGHTVALTITKIF